jgi:DNA-binding NarL/FixJ family response regulator
MTSIDGIERPPRWARPIDVFVVSEVRLYREGLAHLLTCADHVRVLGSADGLNGWLDAIRGKAPDLILVDVAQGNGVNAIRTLAQQQLGYKILAVGLPDSAAAALACQDAGAVGCISRAASREDLIEALKRAAADVAITSVRETPTLIWGSGVLDAARASTRSQACRLTTRELEVLRLVDEGLSNKEIAQLLCIEVATVKNHVHSILQKLDLRRRSQAAAWLRNHDAALLKPRWTHPQAVIQTAPHAV